MQEIFKILDQVDVCVWHYPTQQFISFVPCPGEKRVRIDVYDDLENYAVIPGTWDGNVFTPSSNKPLGDWQIDLT